MERKIRKIIEGIKKIIITGIFSFSLFSYSQNIDIYEEIEGKDLSGKKTEIFYILPSIPFTTITFPQMPQIKIEEKEIEKEKTEEKIEKKEEKVEVEKEEKKNFFTIKLGNFATKTFDINYKDEKINIGFSTFYTKNYRENSDFFYNRFYFSSLKGPFAIDFSTGKMELPGPITNPFKIERDFSSLIWSFGKNLSDFNFDFSHKFYFVDERPFNFINLNIDKNFKNFKLNTEIEENIFEEGSIFSIGEYVVFEKERFSGKLGLKFFSGEGLAFLPQILFKINENFTFFVNSDFEIPDLLKDVITENWKELKNEKILPEKIYKGGIRFELKNIKFEISHSYNMIYLWEDYDSDYLYEPKREEFNQTNFLLNFQIPFSDKLNLFAEIEKNIFDREISFLPEDKNNAGIEFKNKNIKLKLWNSFLGKRHFIEGDLKSFTTLNFEINYKGKIEFGFGIYNILDEKYEIAPGYPGEKRKFLFYIVF
jgi:hypothetical protein